jgi:hypothetical protein
VFAAIHCSPILSDLAEGGNRRFLPAFCQLWRNAEGRLADLWRPARQLIAAKDHKDRKKEELWRIVLSPGR